MLFSLLASASDAATGSSSSAAGSGSAVDRHQVLEAIRRHPHPDIRSITSHFACDPKCITGLIDELLADGKISIDKSGFITINR